MPLTGCFYGPLEALFYLWEEKACLNPYPVPVRLRRSAGRRYSGCLPERISGLCLVRSPGRYLWQRCLVRMKAGFVQGLPLANKDQQGEVIYGEIYLAYANWIGTNQTLNLVINPSIRKTDDGNPFSIEGQGEAGERVGDVLVRALQKAYPNKLIDCTVSDNLVLPEPWTGKYTEIGSLAMVVKNASIAMMRNERYSGIAISILSDRIRIYDNASAKWGEPKTIHAHELVGQPTWIAPFTVSFKCPMRGDIRCGDVVKLPEGLYSGAASIVMANTTVPSVIAKNSTTFTGKFLVKSVRHIGSYLTADGDAWVTVFEAYAENWARV